MSQMCDIVVRNGIICDGTGSEPFTGDVFVTGDRISLISRGSSSPIHHGVKGIKIIDANGLTVAPGFIDTHGHSEFTLLADPRAEGKISQGVTTEINGNCGLSAAPLMGEALRQRAGDLAEYDIHDRWETLGEYYVLLEQRLPALNCATLTGHGNLRACVVGYRDRAVTASEREIMCDFLEDSVREGSFGISTGLIYPPGVYSDTEELIALCRALLKAADGGACIYASHMRSEGERLIESIAETIRILRDSGIRGHISHLKTSGESNWHKIDRALSMIEEARAQGVAITCDCYPYTAASTDLDTLLPAWAYEGGAEAEIMRIRNPEIRQRIRREILEERADREYWERVVITSVLTEKNRWMEGENILSIARRKQCEPVDALLEILIDEQLRVGAIFASMSDDNLRKILSKAYVMIGSDSSARSADGLTCRGKPHPRGFGTFPRFLGRFVPHELHMNISEAVRKITLLPAMTFGISQRGILREGAYADITIFDHQQIRDTASYEEPFLTSEGIPYVIVNGVPAVWEGRLTGIRAGRILRNDTCKRKR